MTRTRNKSSLLLSFKKEDSSFSFCGPKGLCRTISAREAANAARHLKEKNQPRRHEEHEGLHEGLREILRVLRAFVVEFLSIGRRYMKNRNGILAGLVAACWVAGPAYAADIVARGEYVAHMADCAACHTGAGGTLSGGRAFKSPFGTIYATNITPDKTKGVGDYTDDEWVSALREGVGRGGKHLYPAMPYTSYTQMTREDALAIKAYVMTLPASSDAPPPNDLRFPFSIRFLMVFWNFLYNPDHRFAPDTTHDAAWNRGAYLAEALGHCQQCHTPRNFLQGLKTGQAYAGALQQGWMAYNITSDGPTGIGSWSEADVAAYLRTGHAEGHGAASGPMAEAVSYSLRYLTEADAQALARYVKSIQPIRTTVLPAPTHVAEDELGARIFEGACASCHRANGTGAQSAAAALAGDYTAADPDATNLVQIVVNGGKLQTQDGALVMPGFGDGYTDTELAAVANYTVEHFGQRAGHASPGLVAKARGSATPKVEQPGA
jgi:mono/diheme cytochrome c family protein